MKILMFSAEFNMFNQFVETFSKANQYTEINFNYYILYTCSQFPHMN